MKNRWRRLDSMDRQLVVGITIVVIVILTLIFLCVGVTTGSNYLKCQTYQIYMPEENFVWNFWTACLVKAPDGTFVNADDYFSMGRLGLFLDETE